MLRHRSSRSSMITQQSILSELADNRQSILFEQSDNRRDQTPEALVQGETKLIHVVRSTMVIMLVLVALGVGFATYRVTSGWEDDMYRDDWDAITVKVLESYVESWQSKWWMTYLASVAITGSIKRTESGEPDVDPVLAQKIAVGVSRATKADVVIWSPWLHTEEERDAWEKKVRGQTNPNGGEHPPCFVCGSEDLVVGAPEKVVEIPTIATYECKQVAGYALNGHLSPQDCRLLTPWMMEGCECEPGSNFIKTQTIAQRVFRVEDGMHVDVKGPGPYSPIRIRSPELDGHIMYDMMSDPIYQRALEVLNRTKLTSITETYFDDITSQPELAYTPETFPPQARFFYPVFDPIDNVTLIGSLGFEFLWRNFFVNPFPLRSNGATLVIEDSNGKSFTFEIKDHKLVFIDKGDHHNTKYDSMMEESISILSPLLAAVPPAYTYKHQVDTNELLLYKLRMYPSDQFKEQYVTNKPAIYTAVVVLIFVFTSSVFITYDCLVSRRQARLMASAMQNDAIVSSLFPESIRAKMKRKSSFRKEQLATPNLRLRNMMDKPNLQHVHQDLLLFDREPIADFFPNVTVMFADISGFTAWSSEREPSQVFRLLESVYHTFDEIANRLGVFKVETIGDCYVAATGMPEPREDHAVLMIQFAYECMVQLNELTKALEMSLGPSTSSLSIRVGAHSGPVTGGVLRAGKASFQLFGDTMNVASKIETTSETNKIQVTKATADLLEMAGASHWLVPRSDVVKIKGKGELQTFWVNPAIRHPTEQGNGISTEKNPSLVSPELVISGGMSSDEKVTRLVNWYVELLVDLLQNVAASRKASRRSRFAKEHRRSIRNMASAGMASAVEPPIDHVVTIIPMPGFIDTKKVNPSEMVIGAEARAQLHSYVSEIASVYRNNAFHNFEHASHVAMSARKILKRILNPVDVDYGQNGKQVAKEIHKSTFGISSDALMQFAVVFSALIHDVDHGGVSNAQLIKEEQNVATKYKNKCVAEQNSLDIAWDILMEDQYRELRRCICSTEEEMQRFRQLIVNAVIATDIADKEENFKRKQRWDIAFMEDLSVNSTEQENADRKATIVFEYIIQASDVAHTMQHWNVYNEWNERLFEERYTAWLDGREPKDPSVDWYGGEIWFFDNYIIPLARKLETCGVFGVSSDEYLSYALENRREWELKGHDVVRRLVEKYGQKEPGEVSFKVS